MWSVNSNLDFAKLQEAFESPAGARQTASLTSSGDSFVCQFQKPFLLQYETSTNKDTGTYRQSQANVELVFASSRSGNALVRFIESPVHRGKERRVWFRHVDDLAPCLAGVMARKREHSTWEEKKEDKGFTNKAQLWRSPVLALLTPFHTFPEHLSLLTVQTTHKIHITYTMLPQIIIHPCHSQVHALFYIYYIYFALYQLSQAIRAIPRNATIKYYLWCNSKFTLKS